MASEKCIHPGVHIAETGTWSTQHDRNPDGSWSHNNEPMGYSGTLHVRCDACGLDRVYPRSRRPAWLQGFFDDCTGVDDD